MSLSLRLQQGMQLSQRLPLSQTIDFANIMTLPIITLDSVIDRISENPNDTEKILKDLKEEREGVSGIIKSAFGDLVKDKTPKPNKKGIIMTPNLEVLSDVFDQPKDEEIIPDVIFHGKENNKPEIYFASHLLNKPELKTQMVPKEFKESNRLYNFLIKEREWKTSTLRKMYSEIGNKQREFIYSLDPLDLHILSAIKMGEIMGLHPATVSKLKRNKFAKIESKKRNEVLPINMLTPNSHHFRAYQELFKINQIFEEESKTKSALSDEKIARRTHGLNRRTITKYRNLAGIPKASERGREYSQNPSKIFQINLSLN